MPPAEDGREKQRDGAWVSDVLSLSYYTKLPPHLMSVSVPS